jgi:hypothetical protein
VKSAYLIGTTSADLERVAEAWRARPGVDSGPGVIQWFDSGFLFNVSTESDDYQESDWREGWRESESTHAEPPEEGSSWYIECRSEEVFARILREAALLSPGRLWVLDSNDVLWPAEAIDPARIVL